MLHVLIVDDELSIRETFQAFLEEAGYDVTAAADFFEAEECLARSLPPASGEPGGVDVVVVDIILPRVNGLALLQRVRQVDEDIPVIMITGEPDVSTAIEAVRHGAYDYIAKPVTQEMLTRIVGRAAERKRLLDEKRRLETESRAHQADLESKVAERTAELEQRHRELAALIEIGGDISATLDLTEVLKRVTRRTAQVCGAHGCTILMLTEDGEGMIPSMFQFGADQMDQGVWQQFRSVLSHIAVSQVPEAQQVIRERRPLFIPDVLASSFLGHLLEPFGVKSVLVIPLTSKEQVIGLMALDHVEPGWEFTTEQMNLAMAVGAQAATAIENARLYEREQQRAAQRARTLELSRELRLSLDLSETLSRICQAIVEDLEWQQVILSLRDYGTKTSRPVAMAGYDAETVARTLALPPAPFGELDILREEFRISHSYYIDHQRRDAIADYPDELIVTEPAPDLEPGGWHPDDILLVPIEGREGILGFISPDNPVNRQRPTPEMAQELEIFADQAAVAIENARLFEAEKRRVAQLRAISKVGSDIASILDLNVLLHRVVNLLVDVFGYYYANILMVDEEAQEIVLTASAGQTGRAFEGYRLTIGEQGIAGWVAGSGEPLLIDDVDEEPRYHFVEELADTKSELAVPIKLKGKVIGVMDVQSNRLNAFDEMHLSTLLTLADQITVAMENARLLEEARQHVARLEKTTRDLELVHRMSQVVSSSLDLTRILETAVEQMGVMFDVDHSGILLFDQARTYGQVVAEYPSTGATAERFPVQGYLAAERIIADREPLVIKDVWSDPLMATVREAMHRLNIRSMLIVPLIVKGEVVGSVGLDAVGRQRHFDAEEVALAHTVANQVAVAIENARLFEQAQRRWQEAETLYRAAQALATTLDLRQVFECILSELQQVVPYDSASVQLLRDGRLEIIGGHGFPNLDELLGFTFDLSKKDNPNVEVMRQRAPFIVDDAPVVYPEFREGPHAAAGIRAWLGVPLLFGDRLIGMLALDKQEPGFYTSEHAHLALAFAAQAAIAIENAHLYEETQQRARQWEALTEVGRAIGSILDLDEVLQLILERLEQVVPYDTVSLWLREGEVMRIQAVRGFESAEAYLGLTIAYQNDALAQEMVSTRRPLILADAQEDERFHSLGSTEWVRSWLGVPLLSKGEIIGLVTIDKKEVGLYTAEMAELALAFGQQAAVVIENARLYAEARRHVEELTALHTIDVTIASTLELDKVLRRVYEQISMVMNVAAFHIALYDEEKDEVYAPIIVDQGKWLPPQILEGGLSRWVVHTREPLWIGDMEKELDALPVKAIVLGVPSRSLMILPLIARDKVVGVISVQSDEPHFFDEDHRRLFSGIAGQVAIAVENARLYEEAKHRLAEATLIQEVMLAAASTLDFDLVLERTVKALHRALGIDRLGFLLPDERDSVLATHPSLVGFMEGAFHIPVEGTLVGQAYRTGQPMLMRNTVQEPAYFDQAPDVRSALAVPVRVGGRIVAVLHAESTQAGAFGEDELRLFTTIAGQLGVTLENARLYQRLEAQAAELSRAYGELQEINRLRTELVQNVGHELRTPLSLIKGYVDLLLGRDLGELLNSQAMALQVVRERTVALERLIQDLTVLQAVPREALVLTPVSIVEVVQYAVAEIRHSAEKAGITFREELPAELPPVLGDRGRLELVFGHLMDNAIKFSPDGGAVTICAWANQELVYISVTDQGIGILSEHLNRIFERFYQVDGSARRRFGGMGVGLALVWEIIEAHDGTVEVQSEPGKGSTFTVALPQAELRNP